VIVTLVVSAPIGISFQVFVIATPLAGGADGKCLIIRSPCTNFILTGSDFALGLSTVDFVERQSEANISININDDDMLEPAEDFMLTFIIVARVTSIRQGNITQATGRILNDDSV